jgi:hypothetical protein
MPTAAARLPALPTPEQDKRKGLLGRIISTIYGLLQGNVIANLLFGIALVIGFLHGWLKLTYPYAWMTFAYDIPMVIAMVIVMLRLPKNVPWFPESQIGTAIKLLVGCCILYVLLPLGVPWILRLASLRGWCLPPLMMLLGYHVIRSVRQMEIFVWLVILLGVGTSIYGIWFQSEEQIRAMMLLDPSLETKLIGNFYTTSQGTGFRRFSTFVSAAVFGTTMAICTVFAVTRLLLPGVSLIERAILLPSAGLCSYAVISSGSRTSLVLLALGIAVVTVFRKGMFRIVIIPAVLVGVALVAIRATDGVAGERFLSLLDYDTVAGRIRIVVAPAIDFMLNYPFGGGVGRSGHGVPGIFLASARGFESRTTDGDLGRIVADMGILGLAVYVTMLYSGASDSIRWMWKLRESNLSAIAAPAGALFLLGLAQVTTGSPYLGIPSGTLLWLLFGGLRRMVEEYDRLAATEGESVEDLPQFVSFVRRERMTGLYAQTARNPVQPKGGARPVRWLSSSLRGRSQFTSKAATSNSTSDRSRGTELPRSKPRFLFRRDPTKKPGS